MIKRLAAVDVGTNTVRMLAAECEGSAIRPLARLRRITALGRELKADGRLGAEEVQASIEALASFRKAMDSLGVDRVRACGTAALREAGNRDEFLLRAGKEAGVAIEVIDASEEARLTWEGVRWKLPGKGILIMDIGGGSTELIAGPRDYVSLPIGVVVTGEILPLSDPPKGGEIANLGHFLGARLDTALKKWSGRRFGRLVGTAGTFTTLAALDMKMTAYRPERIDGYHMAFSALRRWEDRLVRMTDAQRLSLPGMERGRERYVVPGIRQAVLVMEKLGLKDLVVSDAGILEGIIRGMTTGLHKP
jgi:exopolyphosphatase/guanosine-5'-triphosphate,3'-diphosphate pyrophosphatase